MSVKAVRFIFRYFQLQNNGICRRKIVQVMRFWGHKFWKMYMLYIYLIIMHANMIIVVLNLFGQPI